MNEIDRIEEKIRNARNAWAQAGGIDDTPYIEQLVDERERMMQSLPAEGDAWYPTPEDVIARAIGIAGVPWHKINAIPLIEATADLIRDRTAAPARVVCLVMAPSGVRLPIRKRDDGDWEADPDAPPEWTHAAPSAPVVPSEVMAKYDELLYAVGSVCLGESRHETALRYIRQAESQRIRPVAQTGMSADKKIVDNQCRQPIGKQAPDNSVSDSVKRNFASVITACRTPSDARRLLEDRGCDLDASDPTIAPGSD